MKKFTATVLSVLLVLSAVSNAAAAGGGFRFPGPSELFTDGQNKANDVYQDFLETYKKFEALKESQTEPTSEPVPPEVPVSSVSFTTGGTVDLYPGKTFALSVAVLPEDASYKSVFYHSSNPGTASVDAAGLVTAKAAGSSVITAVSNNGKYDSCTVNVVKYADSIAYKGASYTIGKGEAIRPSVTPTPADAYIKDVTYTSSAPSVVSVDQNGVIKGLQTGSATITAKTANNKKASCKITVKPAPSSITLNITSQKIFIGQKLTLKGTVNSGAGANILTYTSSNPSVASVSSGGVVTSLKRGSATITCTAYNGVKASCTITSRVVNYTKAYTSNDVYRDIGLIAKQYPNIVSVSSAGKSTQGQDLALVKLGRGPKKALITAGIHSREHLTITFTMLCLEEYAAAYYSQSGDYGGYNMKDMLDRYTLYIVPMMNPDGTDVVTKFTNPLYNYTGSRMEFKSNANGVNLNRNFPFYWSQITDGGASTKYTDVQKYKGPSAGSEAETKAIMNLCKQNRFEWLFSMHLRGNCIYWRDTASGTVPNDWALTQKLVNKCGYWAVETSTEINDFGGGLENWFRGAYNRPGFCIELVPSNIPSPTDNSSYHRDYVKATNWTKTKYTFVQGML